MNLEYASDNKLMEYIKDITFEPIFIMGLHRSGTSILYQMLGKTGNFNTVTAYHILKYDELLYNHINNLDERVKESINKIFKNKGIKTRKIDQLSITADYNQEYRYLFSSKDRPLRMSNKNRILFENLCKKIIYITNNNKSILLKNPYDITNFLYIKKIFPNARFIFIHRNPLFVLSSLLRTMKFLLKNRNEYTAIFSKGYRKLFENPFLLFLSRIYYTLPLGLLYEIHSYSKVTKYFLNNIEFLSKNDYMSIRYEDLCYNPNKTIATINNYLQIQSKINFKQHIKQRKLSLIPEVKNMEIYIYKKMKSYFEYFNYTL